MKNSKRSLSALENPLLPFFADGDWPVSGTLKEPFEDAPEVEEGSTWSIDQALLVGLNVPIVVGRVKSELERNIHIPFRTFVHNPHQFSYIDPCSKLVFIPLDNTPSGPSMRETTTLTEAWEHLYTLWTQGDLAPLDWHSFALLMNQQLRGEEFYEQLVKQYHRYHKITIVFSNHISSGKETSEQYYVVWERIVSDGVEKMQFKVIQGYPAHNLGLGETILAVCVSKSDVVLDVQPTPSAPCCFNTRPSSAGLKPAPTLVPDKKAQKSEPTLWDMINDPDWKKTWNIVDEVS